MEQTMFKEYPDVVDVNQFRKMLGGIGYKSAYKLLRDGNIRCFKVGKGFRIPKISVIEFILQETEPHKF